MTNKITVIKSVEPERVCKTYALTGGALRKTAVANITTGVGHTREVETAQDLIKILKTVTGKPDLAIMPGEFNGDNAEPFKIVSEGALANAASSAVGKVAGGVHTINGKRVAARLKRGITPSCWVLIDADDPEGIPAEWAAMNIQQRLELLEPIIPGLSKCERIELRGSSARVHKEGEEPGQATHAWIKVSDADKIEMLYTHTKTEMVLQDLCFMSPRYSKKTGESIGRGEARTVVDLSVWTTGRLVFCAQSDVSDAPGYVCAGPNITLVNEGAGVLDIGKVKLPTKAKLKALRDKTGVEHKFTQSGDVIKATNAGELAMDTPIEVRGTTRTLAQWADEMGPGAKMRCEAPFRDSSSEAAFIKTYSDGPPTVHDVGVSTTYTIRRTDYLMPLNDCPFEAVFDDMDGPDFPDMKYNAKGVPIKPLATRNNLERLVDWAGLDVRFDVYNRRMVAGMNNEEFDTNVDAMVLDLAARYELPKAAVTDQLDALAYDRSINKPLQWLEGLGKPSGDPLAQWLYDCKMVSEDEVQADKIHLTWPYIIWSKFFIACCAAADQLQRTPNKEAIPKFEQVICVVSKQGMKKSTAIRELLPKALHQYFGEGVNLNLAQKDSYIEATGYWIAELGELDATFRKSDIAALKAFLSKQRDEFRLPYAKRAQSFPRRTVFFASVNVPEFLQDNTGNRRYLPIELEHPMTYSPEMGEEIFSQAWHRYLNGDQWWLTDDEDVMAKAKHRNHDGNIYIPSIMESFDTESERRDFMVKPGDLLEVFGLRGEALGRARSMLKSALEHFDINKAEGSYRERRYYAMPPATDGFLRRYAAVTGDVSSSFEAVCEKA